MTTHVKLVHDYWQIWWRRSGEADWRRAGTVTGRVDITEWLEARNESWDGVREFTATLTTEKNDGH